MKFKDKIRTVPDFPKKGIMFKDITTLLKDADAFRETIDIWASRYKDKSIEAVVGIESRGFIFGSALAYALNRAYIPIRKPGKLPAKTLSEEYTLEYGTDRIEIHIDALRPGTRVLLIDDLLATGGTAYAAASLLERMGANIVAVLFLIELTFLNGREKLGKYDVDTLITYDEEA